MVATEHNAAAYQSAARHLLDATVTDPRWGSAWLCLGEIALASGEYDTAEQFLLKCLEAERRGPGFGYFIGAQMLLATVMHRSGNNDRAREIYSGSTASLESCDHVYREAMLALTACGLGHLLVREGRAEAALTEFRRACRLVKEYPRMLPTACPYTRLVGMSPVYTAQGENLTSRVAESAARSMTEIA
jgi:tetratricopeptide (TPR) repeat protein